MTKEKTTIKIEVNVTAPVKKVWNFWTQPNHITHWNFASDDWHCPWATNDARKGEKFVWRMEAKDGSFGFDFWGVYDEVDICKLITSTLGDGRKVKIVFSPEGNSTKITEYFEAEDENPVEMQRTGWQAILNNFKKYVEATGNFETLHFELRINASPEKVYSIMLGEKHYGDWTSVFNPTSHFEGSWEKGSEIRFIGTDKDGKTGGMISKIEENIPNRFVSILHTGIIHDGKEITEGAEIEEWSGAHENYTFEEQNRQTLLKVNLDSNQQFKDYFMETFPKALERLKTICEQ